MYTGISKDVRRRIRQHKGEIAGGAKSLRGKGPLQLEAMWQTHSRSEASKFEAHIKGQSRSEKDKLLKQTTGSAAGGFHVKKCKTPDNL